MTNVTTKIAILNYPTAMQSTITGLLDTFHLANDISEQENIDHYFDVRAIGENELATANTDIVIVPPGLTHEYFKNPDVELCTAIVQQHQKGTRICSVCGGCFILAQSGILDNRRATTHWQLADELSDRFPSIDVEKHNMLINDGNIITTGGIMSWIDLALELVLQHTTPHIMRLLGRYLIVDTGEREQRFYQSFKPSYNHGDKAILKAQLHLHDNFNSPLTISSLSDICFLGERTFLRRFVRATQIKPKDYLQRLRIQKACELLESTVQNIEEVAMAVGYRDTSSFRKTFTKNMGLTPSEFTHRFSSTRKLHQTTA